MSSSVKYSSENGNFIIFLCGRIDTSNADACEKELSSVLDKFPEKKPVFDASELDYISSAGLRVLMRLRKKFKDAPEIINTSDTVYEIFETTGFTELFSVTKKMRTISVEGCKVIGRGFYGTIYRIDEETIVKVYESPDSLSMIKNEKFLAKTALVAGVPTAISYDIVRVGNSYGSVFELLEEENLNEMMAAHPERADDIIKQYAQFLRLVHSQTVPEGKLVSSKKKSMEYLDAVSGYLDEKLFIRLKELLSEIPEQNNFVHGDAHMKNIMVKDGEPVLIDMDTISAGHPIFDLQSVYVTYYAFQEDNPDNSIEFLGIPTELSYKVWTDFIKYYFETDDEEKISVLRDKITIVGCIRFLFLVDLITDHNTELFRKRIEHTTGHLKDLAFKVSDLMFD